MFKTPASRAPCARGGLQASLLFTVAWGLGWRAQTWAPRGRKKKRPRSRWVLFVSFRPFRTTTVNFRARQKVGMLAAQAPQTRPFGLLRSLLRALTGTKLRAGALLTRRDVPFNLVADCVP
jgi:hypothetical protein